MGNKGSRRQKGLRIDKKVAAAHLHRIFVATEQEFLNNRPLTNTLPRDVVSALGVIFSLETQAYREALIGCCLAKLVEPKVNVTLPYAKQGDDAFSGRTLDKEVVNLCLKRHRIPSSTGPYLSSFRRSIKFVPETVSGLRDKADYSQFLRCLEYLTQCASEQEIEQLLAAVLWQFLELRQKAQISLVRVGRFSLPQYDELVRRLLESPSGGRWPVLLATAMFKAISKHWSLKWTVEAQGINVADASSGAAGDVTVKSGEQIVLAAEVTERLVDRSRVVNTFTAKIAETGVRDYIFFASPDEQSGATAQAQQYFAQGHDINFANLWVWLHNTLLTVGSDGRATFADELLSLLGDVGTPATMKVTWNHAATSVASGQ